MAGKICIHGHCYQPLRVDPWLEEFLAESSAAPYLNWNERICRECYSPLAWARRMDQGRVVDIINCYEWISFNFGPTLLTWMERHAPDTYGRILEGDARSCERLGHGNAMAQVYHHAIMPLTTDLDREIEIRWSVQDFQARFKRKPEGMWLAETAVDTPTLEVLARTGITFTVLAPRQAKSLATMDGSYVWPVDETTLDTSTPYQVNLPSGRTMTVFFYNGSLARAVAFEHLLADGEAFFQRLAAGTGSGLCSLATDGESYGHHFKFGEMALAYAIHRITADSHGYGLTNYAAFLEKHPPSQSVILHEKSSWSCVHGVERWKSHCGCSNGDHPGWTQHWRQPLRRALNYLRYYVDEQYFCRGKEVFADPRAALLAYGKVLCGLQDREAFLAEHCLPGVRKKGDGLPLALLTMQSWSLASFASCAWFFDDIGRIEPVNGLAFALRSLELLQESGGRDVSSGLLEILEEAQSNDPAKGDGVQIWKERVLPRRMTPCTIINLAAGLAPEGEMPADMSWPGVEVAFHNRQERDGGWSALARVTWTRTGKVQECSLVCSPDPRTGEMRILGPDDRNVRVEDLEDRALDYLVWRKTREDNVFLWREEIRRAHNRLSLLRPFGEGQNEPLGDPGGIFAAVAWLWVTGRVELSREYLTFLRTFLGENLFFSHQMCSALQNEVLELLAQEPVPLDLLRPLLGRTRDIGGEPSWWVVQNRVWKLRAYPGMARVAEQLGMVLPG